MVSADPIDGELQQLVRLLRERDELDARITRIVGRSARPGDVSEFVAARVFDIRLAVNTVQAGHDGMFRSGPLSGQTVNVKLYGDARAGIDIGSHPCDYYLVLSGPPRFSAKVAPPRWSISAVHLFETDHLLRTLRGRGTRVGIATGIRRADLEASQIYPETGELAPLQLTDHQHRLLKLFG